MQEQVDSPTKLKVEPDRDSPSGSSEFSPEPEQEQAAAAENPTVQKRKGGRKPIYATSEERKQRNRQAQAAFRERRTEYIKQLETTIKHHEDSLQSLQQGHRNVTDECLMLRYKTSLLERIMLEKGIDVQAELNARSDGAQFGPRFTPLSGPPGQPNVAVPHMAMNRAPHVARGITAVPPTLDTGHPPLHRRPTDPGYTGPSGQVMATSPSQTSSPVSGVSAFPGGRAAMTPPGGDGSAPARMPQPRPGHGPARTTSAPHVRIKGQSNPAVVLKRGDGMAKAGNYYPGSFQSHLQQLEQEYDAPVEMVDDHEPNDSPAGPGPYPQSYPPQSYPANLPAGAAGAPPHGHVPPASRNDGGSPAFDQMHEMYQATGIPPTGESYEVWQDMNFQGPFSFPPSSVRR